MKRPRLLPALGGLLALLLVLLLVLPMLFKDKIAARVKTAVNQNVNARVDWRDARRQLLPALPQPDADRWTTSPPSAWAAFRATPWPRCSHLGCRSACRACWGSVMGGSGPIVVRDVELDQPRLVADRPGGRHRQLGYQSGVGEPRVRRRPKAMDLSLRRFEIKDGDIAFDNRQAKLKATLKGLNQSLSGDFSQKQVDVQTRLDADTASVTFAGIPYLNRVKVGLTADAAADLAQKSYILKDTELSLNDLKLGVSGSAKSVGKLLGLDLAFKAPSTNFRSILSLVPAVYARDFDKVKTSGSFTMDGRVKGEYGDSAFPAFAINAKVNDAAFQYPDLPLPARSIFLDLALTNPGGSADSTVVKLDRFHLRIGAQSGRSDDGAPDAGIGSQRGSHGQGQAGSGRRPPQRSSSRGSTSSPARWRPTRR